MDKLKMHSADKVNEHIEQIAALFPNCKTEVIKGHREDGSPIIEYAIDFDVLRQELSDVVVEGPAERYQFTWPEKRKSILAANAPIAKTLRPCREESVDFDTTENLYIEGDNLDVLKLLQETYLGKVKMIYIDPPYNTGNDFVYEDDFAESAEEYMGRSGDFDVEGNRLVKNTDSNGRFHTDWLNMIYPRLKLAKDLLDDDGVIFISIDDNECANLQKICDEVFGPACFCADIAWQRTYSPRNDSKEISQEKEHLLVYSKTSKWTPHKLPRTAKMDSKYKNPDNDDYPWRTSDAFAPNAVTHQGMVYAIQNPFTGDMIYPYKGACWPLRQSEMLTIMQGWGNYELRDLDDADRRAEVCGITAQEVRPNVLGIVLTVPVHEAQAYALAVQEAGKWPRFFFTKNGKGGIARKTYLKDTDGRVVTNLWPCAEVGHTDEAKKEIKLLFDDFAPFDTPKPTRLLDRILAIATSKESLVMDFFSGSATTAHAIMLKNSKDGGQRKYIMVQLPEKSNSPKYSTLCEIGKERIRRAGKKIKEENPLTAQNLDVGFRVLKVDSTNMQDVYYNPAEIQQTSLLALADNIKPDRTAEDLLFQVMLDLGVLLSSKIEQTVIGDKTVFSVADGYLLACFDSEVTDEVVTAIAQQKPYYFVMRDSSLASDSVATNFEQIFTTYSPTTIRKVL